MADDVHECLTCGKKFDTENGKKIHHKLSHGESIAGEFVSCEWCGDEKRVPPAIAEQSDRHFCDSECKADWQSENWRGENATGWEGGEIEMECDWCGDTYSVPPANVERSRFCSEGCKYQWRSENFRGKNHPQWKGGQFPYGEGWDKQKRREVRRRDNYRCQDCGIRQEEHLDKFGRKLAVHHIIPAREIDDPEERNAKDNLITLCKSCHPKWEQFPGLRPDPNKVTAD